MIVKGRQFRPQRVMIYGPEGIYKSTLASQFPVSVTIDTEDRTSHLNIDRIVARTWNDLDRALDYIQHEPHFYQTLVLDSLDWSEKLATTHVLDEYRKDSIEDFGFGKGYVYVYERMESLLRRLEEIQKQHGMHIAITCHARLQRVDDPITGTSYDRYVLKCREHGKTNIAALYKEWVDALFFAHYETIVQEDKDGTKRAIGGMNRVLGTCHTAGYDAKNSYADMPSIVPMEWASLAPYIEQAPRAQCASPTSSPGEPQQPNSPAQASPSPAPGDDPKEKLRLQNLAIELSNDAGGKTYVSQVLKERDTNFKKMTLDECRAFVNEMRQHAANRVNQRNESEKA